MAPTKTTGREQDQLDELDASDAAAALWHVGDPRGRRPGRFTELIVEALSHATAADRALLSVPFPGLSAAFDLAVNDPEGPDMLALVAEGRCLDAPVGCRRAYIR